MKAIETIGFITRDNIIRLNEKSNITKEGDVKVIILYKDDDDLSDSQLLKAAANNTEFDFLNDESENIYTVKDGKKFGYGER
ncbi:MAG: hypothetical protein NTY74_09190 [Ignavibacteriae bacterium]|nr:hypothetical protein [Ignavibacteriota bacterium]